MGNPNNLIEYTTLSTVAKEVGGPEQLIAKLIAIGYEKGHEQGRFTGIKEATAAYNGQLMLTLGIVVGVLGTVTAVSYMIIKAWQRRDAKKNPPRRDSAPNQA